LRSFVIMQERRISQALAADEHFKQAAPDAPSYSSLTGSPPILISYPDGYGDNKFLNG